MTTRKYTSKSQQTTLTSSVTSGALTFPVVSATTLLGGATISAGQTFTVVIDPDTSLEEIVDITAISSNNLTVTRSADSTSAQDHSAGAVIRHMVIGRDLREANNHIEATGYYNDGLANHALHGLGTSDGNVVGTAATQTLTNKTIDGGSNTLTNIAVGSLSTSVVTLTGTQTLTNKTLTSPTINGGTVSSATITSATIVSATLSTDLAAGTHKITGLATPTATADAATKGYVDTAVANVVASAPAALDTLNELAAALGNDASFSTTVTTNLAGKLSKTGGTMSGAIDMGSSKITTLGTPTASTDAATKGYIDTIFGSTASAAASATAAATSATSAANSATAAATSASSASTSQLAAATSAASASTSQSAAATSAASAATSASSSLTSQGSSAVSATAAATSATSAAASATAAATSATSSATSASAALTSANSASTSAASSLTSANSAATSAASAATSASSAATSASSSLTTYNTYKTYYLGTFASAPTLDNQGGALITGATYFSSTTNTMYVYNGSTWSAISSATSYSAPTLGSTTINSGTTYSTLNGVTLTSATVTLTADPTTSLGAATKQYVDLVTAGINYHAPVIAASVSNLSANYSNGTSGVGATLTADTNRAFSTLDGQSVSIGQRILIKDQTSQLQNGIYTLTTVGSGSVPWVITRATDNDQTPEIANGDVINVTGGTVNSGKTFVNSSASSIIIGTTAITFASYYTGLPSQTGSTGQILTTDGTTPSWTNSVTNLGLTTPTIAGATMSGTVTSTATVTGGTLNNTTLTGTVTAGGGVGTNGYYLQTTGTGVQWAAVAGYTAPTIGSTSIGSGATVTTIAGLTLTSPTETNPYVTSPKEVTTVSGTAITATYNFDALTQGVLYVTASATSNFTLNFRGSSTVTLNTSMAVGASQTVSLLSTNGSTAYYPSAFQIDGTSVTPKWSGGTAPSAGNASAIDAYQFTIIKTASTPTYTVLAAGPIKYA